MRTGGSTRLVAQKIENFQCGLNGQPSPRVTLGKGECAQNSCKARAVKEVSETLPSL